jgi:hypothetical protein
MKWVFLNVMYDVYLLMKNLQYLSLFKDLIFTSYLFFAPHVLYSAKNIVMIHLPLESDSQVTKILR